MNIFDRLFRAVVLFKRPAEDAEEDVFRKRDIFARAQKKQEVLSWIRSYWIL